MKAFALLPLLFLSGFQDPDSKPASTPGFMANFQHALGRAFPGPWQPYVLDLDNNLGRDVEVRIRVEEELSRTVVERRETVPNQAKRRVFLYLPVGVAGIYGGAMQPKVKVTDPSGRALWSYTLPSLGRAWSETPFTVGLLSGGEAGSDRAFGLPQQSGGQPVEVGRFTAATFPDRWIGLSPLDALILHDPPLGELTPDQGRALLDWVRNGGTLFLSPGKNRGIYSHDLVKTLATIRAAEPEIRNTLPRLTAEYGPFREKKDFVYHRIENGQEKYLPAAGREVLDFPVGFGRVVALRFNVRDAPFDTWPGLEALWRGLLDLVPRRHRLEESAYSPVATFPQRQGLFQAMANFVNPYPSFMLLIGITVLFITVVGPANYMLLRRLRMTLLVVLSVPAVSAVFLTLILGLGYLIKGTSTVVHSVRYLHARAGLDCARETQLYSIFSPSTRTYDVSFGSGSYGLPYDRIGGEEDEYRYGRTRGGEHERLECEQDASGVVFKGLGVGQWRSRHFEARAAVDLGGAVSFSSEGGTIRIANGTKRAIARGVHFKVGKGGVAVPFGAIPPGGSVTVDEVPAPFDPIRDLGYGPESFAARLFRDQFQQLPNLNRSEARFRRFLLCVLEEDAKPPVGVDARLSSDSRSMTLLQVTEDRP